MGRDWVVAMGDEATLEDAEAVEVFDSESALPDEAYPIIVPSSRKGKRWYWTALALVHGSALLFGPFWVLVSIGLVAPGIEWLPASPLAMELHSSLQATFLPSMLTSRLVVAGLIGGGASMWIVQSYLRLPMLVRRARSSQVVGVVTEFRTRYVAIETLLDEGEVGLVKDGERDG
jgi:hypothetical protein